MEKKQKVEEKNRPAFIKVSTQEDGAIKSVEYGYDVFVAEKKDSHYHFYIPGFNIFFFAKTQEEAGIKADAAMNSFFNYWVKNQGKRSFFDEIKKLGFEEKILKLNRNFKLPANRPNIPSSFSKKAFSSKKIAA